MSRTIRSLPHWVSSHVEFMRDPEFRNAAKYARKAERMERGADGAFRSDNIQSAKAGKLDNWSSAPKGRRNKRIATKQVRRFHKDEIRLDMEAESMEDAREEMEARLRESEREHLNMVLEWAMEDKYHAESELKYANMRIENIRARLAELD